ncbi:MAG: PKD domain-containing protein [Planctomycetota bacterium]|nr:PKD domain-containing protein [Planctomycetota bacterium]
MLHRLLPCALAFSAALAAQSPLETVFVGNTIVSSALQPGISQYFDVQVTNPAGIVITQIDANLSTTSNATGGFDIWVTAAGGSHAGNQTNPSVWTLVSSNQHNFAGGGRQPIVLSQPFFLASGTYGVTLHSIGFNPIYTNPASQTPPLPPTYANADLTIDMTSARSRASLATDPFGGGSNGFSPRHANIAVHYVVGAASVDFSADVTAGISPLQVNFTGFGTSVNPGGVLAWAWDFENDGVIDSTVQNPSHTYPCGTYTVSLTLIDAAGTYTETKVDYIVTDIIAPDFSVVATSPNTLQFLDLTTPPAQTWSWDLDGDGIIDSTQQNPQFTYPTPFCSEADVTLTVSRACQPPVSINRKTAVAKSLSTLFTGGTITTTGATGGVNYFDLQVTSPLGVSLCALHAHSGATAGTSMTYNLYVTSGSYVGNESSLDPWRLVATENALAAGGLNQTFIPLTQDVYLPAGSYGMALEHVGSSPRYSNLGGVTSYANSDLTLTAGATQAQPTFSTGTVFSPRVANVALYYTDCAFTGASGYGFFGAGCQSTLGTVPQNQVTAQPRLGQTLSVDITDCPIGVAFFIFGISSTSSVFGPLPLDLAVFGAPGCQARVGPAANSLLLGVPGGTVSFNLGIPNDPGLLCVQFFTQSLVLDSGGNQLGAVMSDAAAGIVGQ